MGVNTLFDAVKNDKCQETYKCKPMIEGSHDMEKSNDFAEFRLTQILI
jgi:hypothetical protein